MSKVTKACECCGNPMTVRAADLKRGWGKFCSKSCKARKQEQRTGQYAALQATGEVFFDNTEHQDHPLYGEDK